MVFLLSQAVRDALTQVPVSPALVSGLQVLADCRRCGHNEVTGEREVLLSAAECQHLSTPARGVYGRLAEAASQTRGLPAQCSVYVEVVPGPSEFRSEDTGTQRRIVVSADLLAERLSLAGAPTLLCENLDDCRFHTLVGRLYGRRNGLADELVFDARNGGGSTTAPVFQDLLMRGEVLCLCVVDSDLRYPGSRSEGDTARKARETYSAHQTPIAELTVLPCREAENMIPASVLEDTYRRKGDASKVDAVPPICFFQSQAGGGMWRFVDLKEGLRVFEFLNADAASQVAWVQTFGKPQATRDTHCTPCAEKDSCTSKAKCGRYLVKGFGQSVLADAYQDFYEKNSLSEASRRVQGDLEPVWCQLGHTVWSWGLAGGRVVAP